jgi:putative heme-binding domain-containing protein
MEQEYEENPEDIAELLSRHPGYGGTIAKMLANQPELQKIHYAFALRNMRYGWTLEQRKKYFKWFESALQRSGGASYQGFINNIRTEAMANLSDAERKALASTDLTAGPKPTELPKPIGPGRKWSVDEVTSLATKGLSGRDFENGRRTFAAARCIVCHRFDGEGGATGPDLTNVAARFRFGDLAEAMVEPSKVISDQYRATVITSLGKVITGRIATEQDGKVTVLVDPEDATKVVVVDKDDIDDMQPSKTSLMPADLLNTLSQTELLDLIAYMMSRGNPNDVVFEK